MRAPCEHSSIDPDMRVRDAGTWERGLGHAGPSLVQVSRGRHAREAPRSSVRTSGAPVRADRVSSASLFDRAWSGGRRQPMSEMAMGMLGLGVMGRNLALNIEEKGFSVAAYDAWPEPVDRFVAASQGKQIQGFKDLSAFVKSLRRPRR